MAEAVVLGGREVTAAEVLAPEQTVEGPVTVAPGIVFRLGVPVPAGASSIDVLAATSDVLGGLSVTGPHGLRLALGAVARDPRRLDLALLGVIVDVDGVQTGTACGAAAGGHPAAAVAAAGCDLPAGSLVFSGPLLPAVPLTAGAHAVASFAHLGAVHLRVT